MIFHGNSMHCKGPTLEAKFRAERMVVLRSGPPRRVCSLVIFFVVVILKFQFLDYLISHMLIFAPLKSQFAYKGYIFHPRNWKIQVFGFPVR